MNLQSKMQSAKSENPFYGKQSLFAMYQDSQKPSLNKSSWFSTMTSAWRECSTATDKQLFFTIVFAMGDIPNRQHNAFKQAKVDQGGSGNREAFGWSMEWLRVNSPKQYERFVTGDVVRQFTSLDNVIGVRVQTEPGKKTIKQTVNPLANVDLTIIAEYLATLIRKSDANPVESKIIAKFLSNPRTSARQKRDRTTGELKGQRELQDATKAVQSQKVKLYQLLSEAMGWSYSMKPFPSFHGLKDWKQKFNGDLESVLFSTTQIQLIDKVGFFTFLESLPSGARYRVRRRLLDKENGLKGKWHSIHGDKDFGLWFLEWEKTKATAQQELRDLTEKHRQGLANEKDVERLATVKKEAKVNTGGTTLFDAIESILSGDKNQTELDILIQSVLDKIKFDVPVFGIVDCSGSMNSNNIYLKNGKRTSADAVSAFLVTLLMLKNPSNEVDDLLVRFGTTADILVGNGVADVKQNKFMTGVSRRVDLCDRTKTFQHNFQNMIHLTRGHMGGTDVGQVSKVIKNWIENGDVVTKNNRIEQLQRYPVFCIVSDGDFNQNSSASASLLEMKRILADYGWDGVIVIWDVSTGTSNSNKFANIPNVIHVMGWNPSIINQIFTKITDLDVIDTYLPLKSLFESNRYQMVRDNVI